MAITISGSTDTISAADGSLTIAGTQNVDQVIVGTGASVGSPATNVLTLGTNNAERVRITSDGDVNVAAGGSVFISNGNLRFGTDGNGIDFSAGIGSVTSTSTLFDDYEEGTWTPSVTFGGGSTGITGIFQGAYTKVGNVVAIRFVLSFTSKGTDTGDMVVSGLPFSFGFGDNAMSGFGYMHRIASPQTDGQIFLRTSGTTFFPNFAGYSSGNTTRFTDADIANTTDLRGGIVYLS